MSAAVEVLAAAGRATLTAFAAVAITYVAAYHLSQLAMLLLAWRELRRQRGERHAWLPEQVLASREQPGVTVLIPAFNEAVGIVASVRAILDVHYPDLEVVVINDGSADATLETLVAAFDLRPVADPGQGTLPTQPVRQLLESRREPRLRVLDKRNGGKADALNAGLNYATRPLVCAIDADVVPDRWALLHLARPFLDDPATVASSGMIRLRTGSGGDAAESADAPRRLPRPWLESLQALEYLRAFSVGRLAFNPFNAHLIISGAFGLFSRGALLEIAGYQPFAIGEDMEVVVRLHRQLRGAGRSYRITFVADAVCYTEPPHSVGELGRQRTRWHQGLLTTLRLHRRMALRRRFGAAGMVAMPYFFAFELLAPVVETAGWVLLPLGWLTGLLEARTTLLFVAVAVLLGTATSLAAVAVDCLALGFFRRPSEVARLCWNALAEHLGYHQLTLYFRLRAFPRFYRSIHLKGGWRSPARAQLVNDHAGTVE